ncbi:hypothetical protein P3X46_026424 [Hevea brasiliensis]|uniref:TF-B3 domain-containing protein n=1 Tax=Hevea brasiliensis TaxID=3981 RepID=A0ABQ9KY05_HEVBR|nr:B3 domain-containing transcription factor VRN1 isoform X1 [Hevea brasiliensis]KAJ9152916.1 hypothetical protein P3X46_026424 [Hevea brasiliensis]
MSQAVGPDGSDSPARGNSSCMFYKLMIASILQEKKLRIPEKFVKKYGDELSSIATLTVPNGRMWLVELEKVDRKLWFHNGWHEFVEYYSIRVGYFLVFRYGGESNFNVYIFDLAVSEISYTCNIPGSLQEPCHDNQYIAADKRRVVDNDLIEILGSGPPCHTPISSRSEFFDKYVHCNWTIAGNYEASREKLLLRKDKYDMEEKVQSSQDIGVQVDESELIRTADKVGLPVLGEAEGRTRRRKQRTDPIEHEPIIKQEVDEIPICTSTNIASETFTRRWRPVTPEEKRRTISAADKFKSDNPFFKVILRPSYVYRGFLLHIPSSFARKYLTVTAFITLQVSDGKQWPVRCVSGKGGAKLSKGWTEFVWENSLEEGDVCVFELINMIDIVLKVTIFRVLQDAAPVNQLPSRIMPKLN